MTKKKKKLRSEWDYRELRFLLKGEQKYILHAWSTFDSDGHGNMVTHNHSFCNTSAGWEKLQKKAREYADKGYTVSITKAGV